jgi:hypothetical protein
LKSSMHTGKGSLRRWRRRQRAWREQRGRWGSFLYRT